MSVPSASVSSPASRLSALLALAWPVVLARATQSVIGFSDALMVAPLGEAPLAAVTTGALNAFALIILPMGTVFILQSFASQLRGRGQLGSVRRYAYYGLILSLLSGLFALVSVPLLDAALDWVGYAADVRAYLGEYLVIRLFSVAFAVGIEALGNWYGGLGNTRPAMIAGVSAMLVNLFGNFALIEPHFGLPGFGVAGAAWASVAGSVAGFAVILFMFLRGRGYAHSLSPGAGTGGRTSLAELGRVLRFGLPNGINWFLEFAAYALFLNVVVGRLGTTVLAAFNVVMQINSVSFMPAFGMASAGAIMVGEAIGRRAYEDVWLVVKLTGKTACVFMGSVGALYLLAPGWLMGRFAPGGGAASSAFLEVGTWMLMLSAVWQLFDAMGMTLGEALRAAGDTVWCMWARVLIAWAVFIPLGWLLVVVYDGGPGAAIAALVAYLALLAVALAYRFISGRWRGIQLVGHEPALF